MHRTTRGLAVWVSISLLAWVGGCLPWSLLEGGVWDAPAASETVDEVFQFKADGGTLTPNATDPAMCTLLLTGVSDQVMQYEEDALDCGPVPMVLFIAAWQAGGFEHGSVRAIITSVDDATGRVRLAASLADPVYDAVNGTLEFTAKLLSLDGLSGSGEPVAVVSGDLPAVFFYVVERFPTATSGDTSGDSPAGQSVPAAQSGTADMDPQVALAMANLNFSLAVGTTLQNQAQDMQAAIDKINQLEGDSNADGTGGTKNDLRYLINMVGSLISSAGTTGVDALPAVLVQHLQRNGGSVPAPAADGKYHVEQLTNIMTSLQNELDSLSAEQQRYTTLSATQQMQIQQLISAYNQASQLASNMIAAYGRTQQAIISNLR